MKKKYFIALVFIVILTVVTSIFVGTKNSDKEYKESIEQAYDEIPVEQSKFQIYKDDDNVLDLNYNGKDINQFMTVVSSNDYINLTINFNESNNIDNIYIINKKSGDNISFDKVDEKSATTILKLNPDVDYGIIINESLSGAIRAVENIEEADLDLIKMDMFLNLKCGL